MCLLKDLGKKLNCASSQKYTSSGSSCNEDKGL